MSVSRRLEWVDADIVEGIDRLNSQDGTPQAKRTDQLRLLEGQAQALRAEAEALLRLPMVVMWMFAGMLDEKDQSLYEASEKQNVVYVWRSYRRARKLGA